MVQGLPSKATENSNAASQAPSAEQGSSGASVYEQLLQQYYSRNWQVLAFVLIGCGVTVILVANHVPPLHLWLWIAVLLVVQLIHGLRIHRLPLNESLSPKQKLRQIAGSSVTTSCMHASLLLLFQPQLPDSNMLCVVMVYLAFWAGGIGLCMGYLPNYLAYILPSAVIVAITFLRWDSMAVGLRLSMAGAVGVYVLYLVNTARDTFALFDEAVGGRRQFVAMNEQLNTALATAESANMAKTRFLASASHDLRQPLHALSLFTSAFSMKTLDAGNREIAGHLDTAVSALSSQLDALLDVSKLDAGVLKTEAINIRLNDVLVNLCEEFANQADQKGLTLKIEMSRQAWCRTDSVLLERLLRNLISNSVKYSDTGVITLKLTPGDAQHRLVVKDSGRGIPHAEQERVFDEFYQLDNEARDRTKGLGLGLSIVKRLCELLGIGLSLRSEPSIGTEVELGLLAIAPPQRAEEPGEQEPWAPSLINACVLVIDDEPEVLAGMRALLAGFGCDVVTVASTVEAVLAVEKNAVQVVLADFRLRGDDSGIKAIQALRHQQANLPAVLISGDTAPARLQEAEQAGLSILHKPLAAKLLHQTLVELLGSRQKQ